MSERHMYDTEMVELLRKAYRLGQENVRERAERIDTPEPSEAEVTEVARKILTDFVLLRAG